MLFIQFMSFAQSELKIFSEWMTNTGTQNFFHKNIIKTDANGNVFVAGATVNDSNNYDILVAKYNSRGILQWMQQYDGAGNGDDMAVGLYVDTSGNVYTTGATMTLTTNSDVVTIKYSSSGVQQWIVTYNGTGSLYDAGADLMTDASGNVYITGTSFNANGNTDVITVKYNSSGTQQWVSPYNYSANLNDGGAKLMWSPNGSIRVSVLVQTNGTTYKSGVLNYNTSGTLVASKFSTSTSSGIDQVNDMVTDSSGNIYIAGAIPVAGQGYNYDIIKLNSSLDLSWERTYSGSSSLDDIATGIKVDGTGNVYVTGTSGTSTEGKNIVTLKYNSSGTLQWSRTYNDTLNRDDEANALAMDASGNIYIAGSCATESDSTNYLTMKYNASGNMLWTIQSDGNAHLDDKANKLVIDNNGDIIVTGESRTSSGSFEYMTIKYVEKQIITPTDYNTEVPAGSFSYYCNRGQLINTNDTLIPEIKYYTNNSSPAFYFKDNSSSFVFAHVDANDSTSDTLHRIDMSFQKANSTSKTYPMEETRDYLNYFLAQCPDGITKVHGNKRMVTTSLYSNIDLMYSSNQNGIKMYFIVKPGGNPDDLMLLFAGASSFNLDGTTNALTINSSVGSITFDRPTAYQLTSDNAIVPITGWQCAWQTNGTDSTYKFYTGAYNNTEALVIQVDEGNSALQLTQNGNLEWSTNYGEQNDGNNLCLDVVTNPTNGNIYLVGKTSSSDFPVNSGLNQPTFGGSIDGFVLSFFSNANNNWATFFGGSGIDAVQSVAYGNQSIYVTGVTSSTNLPIFSSSISNSYNKNSNSGSKDAFIARILTSGSFPGTIVWSSYIGGEGNDDGKSIAIDNNSNIYIVGNTTSQNAQQNSCLATTGAQFPLCDQQGNSYFQDHNEGAQDIFITKFDANNNLIGSTFYGSDLNDEVFEINCPGGDDETIILVGNTTKSSDPLANYTPTLYQSGPRPDHNFPLCDMTGTTDFFQVAGPVYSGSSTGFISRFSTGGDLLWATNMKAIKEFQTVTSTPHYDNKNFVPIGDFYVAGYTDYEEGNDNWVSGVPSCTPVNTVNVPICNSNGGYTNDGSVDYAELYIARFNLVNCNLTWGTLYPGHTNMKREIPNVFNPQWGVGVLAEEKTIDITVDNSRDLYLLGTGMEYIYNPLPLISGAYHKDFSGGYDEATDTYILSFDPSNNLFWATYFGTDSPNFYGNSPWPYYADFGGAIATYNTDKLYIAGYSGCGEPYNSPNTDYQFPWAEPPGGAYMDYASTNWWRWNAFITRFGLTSIGVGINDTQNTDLSLQVYPNPASDNIINVIFPLIKEGKYHILNILGEVIMSADIRNTDRIVINSEKYGSGCYIVQVHSDKNCYIGKFIKQ